MTEICRKTDCAPIDVELAAILRKESLSPGCMTEDDFEIAAQLLESHTRLTQEVERLSAKLLVEMQMSQPGIDNDKGVRKYARGLEARIRELKADIKQHQALNAAEHEFLLRVTTERDAAYSKLKRYEAGVNFDAMEAATIERCAARIDEIDGASGYGDVIRALARKPENRT